MIHTKSLKKLGLLGSLYVFQYIPATFLLQALPLLVRQQGMSLKLIGLIPVLTLPWILNFLWAPLIDSYGFTRWGHYRFWIICFQLVVACTTIVCALLNIESNFTAVLICLFLLCLFCSSQDIATDALAVGLLEPDERGLGNGLQRGGGYLGNIIGGGGMLLLLNQLGWSATLLTMATMMVVSLIPVFLYQEKVQRKTEKGRNIGSTTRSLRLTSYFKTFISFCRRPGMGPWLMILLLYVMGPFMANAMFRPLLVDIGLSIAEIGWLLGVVSYSISMLGAIAAGLLITPLGRKRSLLVFGWLEALSIATYLLPAFGVTHRFILYLAPILVNLAGSMSSTALLTVMMDKSRLDSPGTDYTIQTSAISVGGIAASALSGVIAEAIGYRTVFASSIVLSAIALLIVARNFDETRNAN